MFTEKLEFTSISITNSQKTAFTLAEVFSPHSAGFRKAAFTLAEVLITLGIIGVVAAMTLPTLIQNHQKQTYIAGLKKAMSVSANMFKQMQADEEVSDFASTELFSKGVCNGTGYGEPGEPPICDCSGMCTGGSGYYQWEALCGDGYGDISLFEKIIPKYLKVVEMCSGRDCNTKYKTGNLSCDNNKCTVTYYNNTYKIGDILSDGYGTVRGFYTSDGMVYYIRPENFYGMRFINVCVDINGEKGPNTAGRDLFQFAIDSKGKFISDKDIGENYYLGDMAYKFTKHLIENGYNMDY